MPKGIPVSAGCSGPLDVTETSCNDLQNMLIGDDLVHIKPLGLFLIRAVNARGSQVVPTDMLSGAVNIAVPGASGSWEGSEK